VTFVVGDRGTILRDGGGAGSWSPVPSATTRFLRHVWGLDASRAWAVGDAGTVLRWTGAAWAPMATPARTILRGIWGTGEADLFAVGDSGTILRHDGVRWYSMPSPTSEDLRAVWGSGPTDVYAVGAEATVLRYNGAGWEPLRVLPPSDDLLLAIERVEPAGSGPLIVGTRSLVVQAGR
jgi:photosystem II stability/assembly factor-like uncharacterized protein